MHDCYGKANHMLVIVIVILLQKDGKKEKGWIKEHYLSFQYMYMVSFSVYVHAVSFSVYVQSMLGTFRKQSAWMPNIHITTRLNYKLVEWLM